MDLKIFSGKKETICLLRFNFKARIITRTVLDLASIAFYVTRAFAYKGGYLEFQGSGGDRIYTGTKLPSKGTSHDCP